VRTADLQEFDPGYDIAAREARVVGNGPILRGVEELLEDKALSDATYATLAASWSEAQMIEFPQMVGQYVSIAFVQNSLRVPLEPGNGGLAST